MLASSVPPTLYDALQQVIRLAVSAEQKPISALEIRRHETPPMGSYDPRTQLEISETDLSSDRDVPTQKLRKIIRENGPGFRGPIRINVSLRVRRRLEATSITRKQLRHLLPPGRPLTAHEVSHQTACCSGMHDKLIENVVKSLLGDVQLKLGQAAWMEDVDEDAPLYSFYVETVARDFVLWLD